MKYIVEVNGLKVHAFHGVLPEERIHGNLYIVDLMVEYPYGQAMESDNLDHTINYARLCEIVVDQMQTPSSLLENVAWRIICAINNEYPSCLSGKIKIAKTVPPVNAIVDNCAVKIEW